MALPTLLVVQIDLVWSVIRLTTLQRALHEVLPHTQLDFWRTQMGATLDLAVIDWCKVFGSRSDDTHWTRLVPAERHDEIREGLLASLGMDVGAWNNNWDEMKTYRDTNAAHLSLNPGARSQYVPRLDAALQACRYYYQAYLYPAWRADDPEGQYGYPADIQAYENQYRIDLLESARAASRATEGLEPR